MLMEHNTFRRVVLGIDTSSPTHEMPVGWYPTTSSMRPVSLHRATSQAAAVTA